ncbi:lysine--tRNA ligase [Rickettsiales bacterium LUAb2]
MNKEYLLNSKAWPVTEAIRILKRVNNKTPSKGYILLETGYGPSGLPHIGTFGEVTRTSMVKLALEQLCDIPVKIIAFSDDLDGLRKVPGNVPNQELLAQNLGKPLTVVPDPFQKFNSFGEHNNAMLCKFLDDFNFSYEFYSATKCYTSGLFDEMLLRVLENHQKIVDIIAPTLGEERRATYSPFLPIDKASGKVLEAKVINLDLKKGSIIYLNENNQEVETIVTGGNVKLQWKVDWAMRWCALEVDYEMYGKDLIPTFDLSSKVCKALKGTPPENLAYELFLDDKGQKISKSKGNGISIEEWLKYANPESLSLFMYQKPKTAKRLYFDVIPKCVDEWMQYLVAFNTKLTEEEKANSPIFFMYKESNIPNLTDYISFSLIVNLVSVIGAANNEQIWYFLSKYKQLDGVNYEVINSLLEYAVNYYNDFVKPSLNYKIPNEQENSLLNELLLELKAANTDTTAEDLQKVVYNIGVSNNLELKDWFQILYQILLGQNSGPRMGSFFKLLGLERSINLIENVLNKK